MKKISLIALLTLIMMATGFAGRTQENTGGTVIIRMEEPITMGNYGVIVVSPPDDSSYELELDRVKLNGGLSANFGKNSEMLKQEINKYKEKGFDVKGISTSTQSESIFTIVILTNGN